MLFLPNKGSVASHCMLWWQQVIDRGAYILIWSHGALYNNQQMPTFLENFLLYTWLRSSHVSKAWFCQSPLTNQSTCMLSDHCRRKQPQWIRKGRLAEALHSPCLAGLQQQARRERERQRDGIRAVLAATGLCVCFEWIAKYRDNRRHRHREADGNPLHWATAWFEGVWMPEGAENRRTVGRNAEAGPRVLMWHGEGVSLLHWAVWIMKSSLELFELI